MVFEGGSVRKRLESTGNTTGSRVTMLLVGWNVVRTPARPAGPMLDPERLRHTRNHTILSTVYTTERAARRHRQSSKIEVFAENSDF